MAQRQHPFIGGSRCFYGSSSAAQTKFVLLLSQEAGEPGDPSEKDRPLLELVQEYFKTPYFMDSGNRGSLLLSPELWMGANGTLDKVYVYMPVCVLAFLRCLCSIVSCYV